MALTTADGRVGVEIKKVMFVDDDEFLLEGLRDALRPYRHEWSMTFLSDAREALVTLDREPHDVIISDLRMPGMDGASLLEAVRDRHPDVVRIVLSGQAEIKMMARAAAAAHRMIAKPCATEDLARAIERSCALRKLAARMELDRRAVGASALPSVPRLYAELTDVLSDGNAGAADAARVVERDIAMSAKVLQLANSAYFGRRSPVTRVADAVAYLGLEALRALVLQAEVFREFPIGSSIPGFDLEALHLHCGRVARLSAALGAKTQTSQDAFTAGLLHDVGLLVLASHDPAGLGATLASAREQQRPVYQVERDRQGLTHADVGAHLLALWGLPPTVTEAVASHHDEHWLNLPFDGAAVVYVADILVRELEVQHTAHCLPIAELDVEYLERVGLADELPCWRDLAERQFFDGAGSY
jgi:HD-like signal output (HDOD) protein/CheY-like chemotaxis protein